MAKKRVIARNGEGYQVIAEVDGHEYIMDQPKETPGGGDTGTNPGGMLLTALAGCNVMVAKMYLDGKQVPYQSIEVEVIGDYDVKASETDFQASIEVTVDADLSEDELERLARYAERKCVISQIVMQENPIKTVFVRK